MSWRCWCTSVAVVKPIWVILNAASCSFSTFCSLMPLISPRSFLVACATESTVKYPASRSFLMSLAEMLPPSRRSMSWHVGCSSCCSSSTTASCIGSLQRLCLRRRRAGTSEGV